MKSGDLQTVKVFLKQRIGDEAEAFRLAAKRIDKKITDFMHYAYPDLIAACFLGAVERAAISRRRENCLKVWI